MKFIYSFILFFYFRDSKIIYSLYYMIALINPYLIIPSILFIRPISLIYILLGILNHYFFKSKILHLAIIISASFFNIYSTIFFVISPFIFNKKLKLANKTYLYIFLTIMIIIKGNYLNFLFFSLIFIFKLKNKKYSLIFSIIGFLFTKSYIILIASLYNPFLNLGYLIYKCIIGLEGFDIELYFSIILYLLYIILIKDDKSSINPIINYLDKANEVFNKDQRIDDSLNKIFNNVCKSCNKYLICINNKYYLSFLKAIINQKHFIYDCINKSIIVKYKLYDYNSIFLNIKNIILQLSKSTKHTNFFKYLGIINYKVIRNTKNDLLIEFVESPPFFIKYILKPFKYEIVSNYITNKISYNFKYHTYSHSKDSSIIKGDSFKIIDNINNQTFILADGMGYGIKAYNESKSMLDLIEASEKFEIPTKINLLNNTYKYKVDESYSTLDYLNISKVNLEARLYKLGSSKTYLIRGNNIKAINNINAPLGFNTNILESTIKLLPNDNIVMLTDGLGDIKGIDEIILKSLDNNLNKMAYNIINLSTSSLKNIRDDITLIIIKIEKK